MKLNAKELRNVSEVDIKKKLSDIKRIPLIFILENIYDTYNIGGLFRLADALAIEKIYLCGETEIPPNHRIKKASIGTYKVVPWKYCKTVKEAIEEIKLKHKSQNKNNNGIIEQLNNDLKIIAVEQDRAAVDYRKADYKLPLALVFGNETSGILPETLGMVNTIVEIPMWGINKSLNVIVSAAIVSYTAASKLSL